MVSQPQPPSRLGRKDGRDKWWNLLQIINDWPHLLLVASESCGKIAPMSADLASQHIGASDSESSTTTSKTWSVARVTDESEASFVQTWGFHLDDFAGV